MSTASEPDGARRAVRAPVLWLVCLLVVGLVAAGLQADRVSLRRADLAALVPGAMRGVAHYQLINRALRLKSSEAAMKSARQLVLVRPVPAENLSLLAVAAASHGDGALAVRAIGLSAARGWREPLAQIAAARGAFQAGDIASAANRTLALWSTRRRPEDTISLLEQLLDAPEGRAEIARWLRDSPVLRDDYALWGASNLPPHRHGQSLALAHKQAIGFDCTKLGKAAFTMLHRGGAAGAKLAWSGACAQGQRAPDQLIFAPKSRGGNAAPFGWSAMNAASFMQEGKDKPPGWSLRFANKKPGRTAVASLYAGLDPGDYRVVYSASRDGAAKAMPVLLRLGCIQQDKAEREAGRISLGDRPAALRVPDQGCTVQRLTLLAPRGSGVIQRLEIVAAQ